MHKNDCFWLCTEKPGTIQHIISSCGVLARTEYKDRHNNAGKIVDKELTAIVNLISITIPWKHLLQVTLASHILTDWNIVVNRVIFTKEYQRISAILINSDVP